MKMPEAKIYELEMKFMPWGNLMEEVADKIINSVPSFGTVLDLMCGPGYLLEKIHAKRPDLKLVGVDVDARYIEHGSEKKSGVKYVQADVCTWENSRKYDCVICTAGLHHLPYADQPILFSKMAKFLKKDGFCICGEVCIADFADEVERQLSAAELGYEYLKAVLRNGAPPAIVNVAIDILRNDVCLDGEYKNSISKLLVMAKKAFRLVEVKKVWPGWSLKRGHGDYYLTLTH